MTSRVPLVIDFQTQRLTELQENDDLDLTNSRLLNVQEITVDTVTANTISIADVTSTGNIQAAFFIGDGGLLSNISGGGGGGSATPGGVTTQVQFNNAGAFAGSAGMTYNATSNTLTVTNIITDGYKIANIAGANVTGWVPNANVANMANLANTAGALSTAVANVVITGGNVGDLLSADANGAVAWIAPNIAPTAAGNTGEIQFNSANLLSASNGLRTDGSTLTIYNETGTPVLTEFYYSDVSNNSVTTYRARGDKEFPTPVQIGDRVFGMSGQAYTGNGTAVFDGITGWAAASLVSITGTITSTPTSNGKIPGAQLSFNVSNSVSNASSTMTLAESGKLTVPGIFKVASFTSSALRGITGSIGEMAAVTGTGKLAYWDMTNTRWSYIFDNSAV